MPPRSLWFALLPAALAVGRASAQPIVQAEPVIVSESPLTGDAQGVSQVRFPDAAPLPGRSLAGVADAVANLHVDTGGAGSFGDLISLRGLTNTPYFSDPSVAVYFDDIPLGNVFTYPTGVFGFSTVTVARGPQPALYGRAAEGGVITFSSVEPGAQPAGSLRVGVGNYDARTVGLEVRSARTERIDAAVSAAYDERNGYITNTQLGRTVDDQRNYSGTARFRYRPTATSEITLQLLGDRRRDGAQPLVPINGPLFSVARGREGSTDSDFGAAALKFAFDTAIGRLSSTTSRTSWTLDPYSNRLVLPPTIDSLLRQGQRAWNEELRLSSDAHAAAPWHVGAWWSDMTTTGNANRAIPGLFPIEVSQSSMGTHDAAVFGETSTAPMDGWRFTGALRVERTVKEFDRSQQVPGPGRFSATNTTTTVLPKVTASRAIDADTNFVASIGAGAKPGGWSAYTDHATLAGFAAEKAVTFETGIDRLLAKRTVKLALRAFDNEVRDYQIERSFNATDYLVVNAPRARSFGGEAEAAWHPAPEWTLTATFGLTDVTLREFTDPFTGKSYAGRRAPYVPSYDGHFGAAYRPGGGWFAAADATFVGRTFYDESENPASATDAHAVLNAHIGYETGHWRLTLYSENLGDAHYVALMIPGVNHQVPGAPRTYGLEAALKW